MVFSSNRTALVTLSFYVSWFVSTFPPPFANLSRHFRKINWTFTSFTLFRSNPLLSLIYMTKATSCPGALLLGWLWLFPKARWRSLSFPRCPLQTEQSVVVKPLSSSWNNISYTLVFRITLKLKRWDHLIDAMLLVRISSY